MALHTFVSRAHRRLRARAHKRGAPNMGTTLTTLWILGDRAHWVHVGDSRLYHFGAGGLVRLTRDHTRGEFARRAGRKPGRNGGALSQNFIYGSRGLGDDAEIRVDAGTDTGTVVLDIGDRLLLTSDGVHGALADSILAQLMGRKVEPAATAATLADASMKSGGEDNMTAIVVRIDALSGLGDEGEYSLWDG